MSIKWQNPFAGNASRSTRFTLSMRFLQASAVLFVCLSPPLLANVSCDNNAACTQTLQLSPGWNAIYLQVKPDEPSTELLFADFLDNSGPQISAVWTWLAQRAKIEFIQDPDSEALLSAPGWLRFFPPSSGRSFLTNLYSLQANRAYLVKLEGNVAATLSITGKPTVPRARWSPNSYNLTGFHVDPANTPTFDSFLAASPAHVDQPVYELINDSWQAVNTLTSQIQPGKAYWIYSKGGSDYTGPLQVELPQRNRLEYGSVLEQLTARLRNRATANQQVNLQVLSPSPGMFYQNPDLSAAERWLPLPQPYSVDVAADAEKRLPLGVRRSDFEPGNFDHTLEITASGGSRWLIPVTASAPVLNSLWVGTVSIDQVSQAHNYQRDCDVDGLNPGTGFNLCLTDFQYDCDVDGLNPGTGSTQCLSSGKPIVGDSAVMSPVEAEFSFRIILHRESGQVRLLKEVIQMWQDGIGDEPGRYVLLTDDSLIPNYKGVALRDGETVGRRMSTMAYDFTGTSLDMTGTMDVGTTPLTVTIDLAADAPNNPFKHKYHSSHDNLGNDYATANNESYAVTRDMELTFEADTSGLGSGYNVKQGSYREVVEGLHKHPIIASGRFTLNHASSIDMLNQ